MILRFVAVFIGTSESRSACESTGNKVQGSFSSAVKNPGSVQLRQPGPCLGAVFHPPYLEQKHPRRPPSPRARDREVEHKKW